MNRRAFTVLAAAALSSGARQARAADATLRVGCLPIEADASPFYARDLGLFAKAGLHAELVPVTSGAAILSAVLGGSMEIGESNVIGLAAAHARGLSVTCIAATALYDSKAPTSALIVAKDSPIRTARDLDGKTVATNGLRNLGQIAPMAWIDQHGGDARSVKYIELSFPATLTAVTTGRIDAGLVAEPVLSASAGVARILGYPYDAIAPRFVLGCFFTTTDFAQRNAATLRRFLGAIRAAGAWANTHHDESATILAAATGSDVTTLRSMRRSLYPAGALDVTEMQPIIDAASKYGVVSPGIRAEDLVWKP